MRERVVDPSAVRGRTLVLASIALAFVSSFIAVAQHVRCIALGYEVDRAERRQTELLRRRAIVHGRRAALAAPAVLVRRGTSFGLGLGYPAPALLEEDAPLVPELPQSLVTAIGPGSGGPE